MGLLTSRDSNCDHCGQPTEEFSAYCPHCGHPLAARPDWARRDGGVYLLLATANVLRLRGQWAPAEARCSEALQRDPQNAAAHSLMGDIARDQGKLREAIEWYKMALDLNPGSPTDRRKLESLIDRVFSGAKQTSVERRPGWFAREVSAAKSRLKATRKAAPLELMVGGLLVVIFSIAVCTVVSDRRASGPRDRPTSQVAAGGFVPQPDPRPDSPTPRIAAKAPPMAAQTPASQAGEELVARERELLARLETDARSTDSNSQVEAVTVDPQELSAAIRISMPRLWSPSDTRFTILRVAAALAASAMDWDQRVAKVKLRCDLREPEQPPRVGALADATREQVAAFQEGSAAELEKSFGSVWWAPEVRK